MRAEKIAEVMDRFADSIHNFAEELRDGAADAAFNDPEPQVEEAVGREVPAADAPADGDTVEVTYGDLWRLVNRSRKMIRLAREGKVPSMDTRAPLCRAIKALKQQGAVRKPRNVRD